MTKNGRISIVCMNRLRDMLSFLCILKLLYRPILQGVFIGLYKCPVYMLFLIN